MIAAARRRRKEATVAAMAGPHGKLTHPAPPSLDSSQKWSCRDLANLTRPSAARVRGRSSRNTAIDAMAAPPALRWPDAAAWAQTCNLGSNRAKLLGMVILVVPRRLAVPPLSGGATVLPPHFRPLQFAAPSSRPSRTAAAARRKRTCHMGTTRGGRRSGGTHRASDSIAPLSAAIHQVLNQMSVRRIFHLELLAWCRSSP